jgi:adenylate cyclase class 2
MRRVLMKHDRKQEVEVKLAVADLGLLRRRLAEMGARQLGRIHERNALYDSHRHRLAKRGCLLRLRLESRAGKRAQAVLTYKGPAARGQRYKVRDEVEVPVPAPAELHAILEAIGLKATFRYEKFRTSFRLPGMHGLNLELDETPIGVFLELEGPASAIDRAARLLGYRLTDYITMSYRALYLDDCRKRGVAAGDMVFPRQTNRQFLPVSS